ncbi:MAG: BTAD domain-containing putative transcriptional regulator [Acidimicrobiia bacterium]|nr:BTAD domain-containing putative transcriptional regulator [Acidimicrobiia bacterium]
MAEAMEFRLLGPVDLLAGGHSILPGSTRQRDLLTLLLLHRNRVVSTDRLIDRLWDARPPATATSALQVYIAKLRKLLAQHNGGSPAVIVTTSGGYSLEVDEACIDASRFEDLVRRGRAAMASGSAGAAAVTLTEALALWRGDALADVRHLDGAQIEATRLDELRAGAIGDRIDADLAIGKHGGLIAELEKLVKYHPLRERHWEQLMLALYREGRQADALRTYKRAADVLGEELGIEPGPPLQDLEESILLQDPRLTLTTASAETPTNLDPPATAFIGRHQELERITALTRQRPLVTLTGPGGCGKTRLALEIGGSLLSDYPDGVWFVDLAPLTPGDEITDTVAETLGVAPEPGQDVIEAIRKFLWAKRTLLILDNCEHVIDGSVHLLSKLPTDPEGTSVLATSRQRLNVQGETSWTVPPMRLPDPADPPDGIAKADAVILFIDRARRRNPDLEEDAGTLPAAGQICRRLDGLPLAIELAAARANVLSIPEIAERLDERLSLLTRGDRGLPHRHVALRETIRWSYDLLNDDERKLFDRLSVFKGGFTLEAAHHVGETTSETLDLIGGLVEKSLLQAEIVPDRPTRYRSLETLREFAAARLDEADLTGVCAGRHLDYYLAGARNAAASVGGPDEPVWFARLDQDHDNLRAALDRATADNPVAAIELADALTSFWMHRGYAPEGRKRLLDLLDRYRDLPEDLVAKAEWTLGVLAYSMDDYTAARISMERALEIERGAGETGRVARVLNGIGVLALQSGDYATARQRYEESSTMFEALGDVRGVATAELNLGIALVNLGEVATAREHFEAARDRFEKIGDDRERAHCLLRLGFVDELEGRADTALDLHHQSLEINRQLGNRLGVADAAQYTADLEASHGSEDMAALLLIESLEAFVDLDSPVGVARVLFTTAVLATRRGDAGSAAKLYGAEEAIRDVARAPVPAANRAGHDNVVASLQDELGTTQFEALRSRGRMLSRDQTVELALQVLHN